MPQADSRGPVRKPVSTESRIFLVFNGRSWDAKMRLALSALLLIVLPSFSRIAGGRARSERRRASFRAKATISHDLTEREREQTTIALQGRLFMILVSFLLDENKPQSERTSHQRVPRSSVNADSLALASSRDKSDPLILASPSG